MKDGTKDWLVWLAACGVLCVTWSGMVALGSVCLAIHEQGQPGRNLPTMAKGIRDAIRSPGPLCGAGLAVIGGSALALCRDPRRRSSANALLFLCFGLGILLCVLLWAWAAYLQPFVVDPVGSLAQGGLYLPEVRVPGC